MRSPLASLLCAFISLITPSVRAEDTPPLEDKLYAPDRVLDIRIELAEEDWDELCSQSRNFFSALQIEPAPSPFTYFEGTVVIDGRRIERVGVRKKGFLGSLDSKRPSLKIKFDRFVEQTPFPSTDRLTLNNNKQDGSLAKQHIGYQLFNEAGVPAPRCGFAHVRVNDHDLGVYSNVESVRMPLLEREFGDGSGPLYEGTLADFYPDRLQRFEVKSGIAPDTPDERLALKRVAKLLEADGKLDIAALEKEIDLDSFLKYWALESLIGFWDGYTCDQNNFYVYQKPENSKLYWLPWGLDCPFSEAPLILRLPPGPRSVRALSLLAHRLFGEEAIRTRYRHTLEKILADVWVEERLLARTKRVKALVKDHLAEGQRWTFEWKSRELESFIENRRAEVQDELDSWPPQVASEPRVPVHSRVIGTAIGSFSTVWGESTPADPHGSGEATLTLTLRGERVEFRQLGATAEPSRPSPFESVDADQPRPPSIVFHGKRKSNGRELILGVAMSRRLFRPGAAEPIRVDGILIDGNFFSGLHGTTGTIALEAAGLNPGDPVKGTVEVKLLEMVMP